MKRKIIAPLIVAVMLASACDTSQAKKAAQAAQDISTGINLLIETKRDLLAQGILTNAEAIQIDKALLDLNSADRVFAQGVDQFKDGKMSKAELAKLFSSLNTAVRQLNDHAAIVQNEKARATISSVTASIAIAVGVLQGMLGSW